MAKWKFLFLVIGMMLYSVSGKTWGQTVPEAPPAPTCSWDGGGTRSTCKFKDVMAGTPTSVVGNKVILFSRTMDAGHRVGRDSLRSAIGRLADRYAFTATFTEDPAVFTAANLSDAKVVILSNGDGDVVPQGENRVALENFQQVSGWGMLWIHSACAFITAGWPFGKESCVQQFFSHSASGSIRRVFIDSGTSAIPDQGRKNPQSEFLLRQLPGWGGNRALEMADEWHCFQAPARNTAGVNVLLGYDRSSGPVNANCFNATDIGESGSWSHNMAWTHSMGKGITIVNHLGHDSGSYTSNGNMGDSLLWRFIRYAAKDWCVGGSGEPGCDAAPTALPSRIYPETHTLPRHGILSLDIPDAGRTEVSLQDIEGRRVFSEVVQGPAAVEVPGLQRGLYLLRVQGKGKYRTQRILVN